MTGGSFFYYLALVSLFSIGLITICYTILPIQKYVTLGIVGLVLFNMHSIVVFKLSQRYAQSEDLNAFTRFIMYNLMTKLFLSIIIVWIYDIIIKPEEGLFVLPFVIIYLIFTIFEAMFLSRQAKQK